MTNKKQRWAVQEGDLGPDELADGEWMTLRERAARAEEALREYDPDDPNAAIIDLLADLRHYCAREGWDFNAIDAVASRHHEEEINRER